VPDAPLAESALFFGPARCVGCGARYPVHEGLIDFVTEQHRPGALQQAMELPWVARSWERYVRPTVDAVLTRGRLDTESEYTMLHGLVGRPGGPIVDVGCGAGLMLRRLSRDFRQHAVIGVDLSRPMLEEAMAQVREHAEAADFVRAQVPPLPFVDAAVGAVVTVGFLHFIGDLRALFEEVARVLKPGGRLVGTAYVAGPLARRLHARAGLHAHGEDELRELSAQAGLIAFERVKIEPYLLFKAERP
jgi:SAM-dependent methyltransferase